MEKVFKESMEQFTEEDVKKNQFIIINYLIDEIIRIRP